jgi:hypothetical protein
MENTLNEMIEDVEFDRLFDAYDEFCAEVGNDDCDGVGEGPIDGGSDEKLGDGDFLSQLLRQTKAELLVGTAKGLANFEMVKKISREKYIRAIKGMSEILVRASFHLQLLTLKAKHSWLDSRINDLLRLLACLLPKKNKVPADTYRAKKFVSPFTMGVERIYACPNNCIIYHGDTCKDLDKCPVCKSS